MNTMRSTIAKSMGLMSCTTFLFLQNKESMNPDNKPISIEKDSCENITKRFYQKFIKGETDVNIDPKCLGIDDLLKTTTRYNDNDIHDRIAKYIIENKNVYENKDMSFLHNKMNTDVVLQNPQLLDMKKFVRSNDKLIKELPENIIENKIELFFKHHFICDPLDKRFSKGFRERNQYILNSGCHMHD